MLEKALKGSGKYWGWLLFLSGLILVGFIAYLYQFKHGLGVTGMGRDVSWGLYIGQFTFFVGVAASAVMLVLPYYLHDYKKFGKITILGEFLAIPAVIMCMLFIFADMGQPIRFMNIFLYPTPSSVMFWDALVLNGYLVLNLLVGWTVLGAERKQVAPAKWLRPVIILSIIWAPSIHTVTAFLYSGLAARHFWFTAIMAARFLASAFAAGPSLLIILCMILRRTTTFDAGLDAMFSLARFVTYFMITNVFFLGLEVFTVYYSQVPSHMHSFDYLYFGIGEATKMVPLMRTSLLLAVVALVLLINPRTRNSEGTLAIACGATFLSLWIEKGFGLIVGGFVPNPFEGVTEYWPTTVEVLITIGIWAVGLFVLTILYKVAVTVKQEVA